MRELYTAHRRDSGEAIEFPVEWPSENDAKLAWRWDAEHNAFPLTPMSSDVSGRAGMEMAMRALGGEFRPRSITANGFVYGAGRGGGGPPNPDFVLNLEELAQSVPDLWHNQWRPIIEREARELREADYDSLSLPELVAQLETASEMGSRHMDLMFRALHLVLHLRNSLAAFCREIIGPDEDVEALVTDLLLGLPNVSLESTVALWDLAQQAGRQPQLRALVATAPDHLLDRLAAVEGGDELRSAIDGWLEQYGWRNGSFAELSGPTWREDPRVVISLLRDYLDQEDPRLTHQPAIDRREKATREFESRLDGRQRERFHELLALAQNYVPIRESRLFTISTSRGSMRAPVLGLGRKLALLGVIDDAPDVFYLRLGEARAVAEGKDYRTLVDQRRTEHDYWCNVVPPLIIGGAAVAPSSAGDETTVKGIGASAGVITGVARVIMTIEDGAMLRPGEVLVTRSTTSLWTPLFATAAAVVTDGGGMLSHASIVAREYRIPAVVGAGNATLLIPDGSLVTVDGTQGTVTVQD
jgi:phosphohistidine swiveling domain-containing protein